MRRNLASTAIAFWIVSHAAMLSANEAFQQQVADDRPASVVDPRFDWSGNYHPSFSATSAAIDESSPFSDSSRLVVGETVGSAPGREPFGLRQMEIDSSIAGILDEAELDGAMMVELGELPKRRSAGGLREFWGYRYSACSLDWIIGKGDQFGMFSLNGDHFQPAGVRSGFGFGLDFHFLSGPVQSEMPPRVFDFSVGYQCRRRIGIFGYDVAASVTASSDFEGSAREGIRYPGHAVGYFQFHPSAELVFGVDYLDWGTVKLLPVAGIIWFPRDDVRLDLVFPQPRATFVLPTRPWWSGGESTDADADADADAIIPRRSREHRLYVGGELGGGTWAVERWEVFNDLATYRDLRLSVGLECVETNGSRSAVEVSYLFGRRLDFKSGIGDMDLDDTVMLRWIGNH